jgi:hypothetical protein
MDKRVLIGTFIRKANVSQRVLKEIVESFNADKIFIFSVEDEAHKRLVTFNVLEADLGDKLTEFKRANKNTLRLHRNKNSNTFYTINSLNKVVEKQIGKKDIQHEVDWKEYQNSCLVLDQEGSLKVLKTKLAKVIDYNQNVTE